MKGLLTITDTPVGSHSRGSFIIVETKEVGTISVAYMNRQISISGYSDDWGGKVKKINIDIKKVVEEKELPEELKGLKVIKLEKTSKKLEIPEELVKSAFALAKLEEKCKIMQYEFRIRFMETIINLIGHLHTSKGDRIIGGKK